MIDEIQRQSIKRARAYLAQKHDKQEQRLLTLCMSAALIGLYAAFAILIIGV